MRILFLCHRYTDVKVGGLAEVLHYLPIALKKIGIESIIYTQAEKPVTALQGPMLLANGISQYSGPFIRPDLISTSGQLKPLIALCKQENIAIIHAQGLYRSGFMAFKTSQAMNIPYIITSHSDVLRANSARMRRASVQRRCKKILQNAKAVTHLTPMMLDASQQILVTHAKDFIVSNGIDADAWRPFVGLPEKNYLIAMGRLEPGKGFDILIKVYSLLHQKQIKTSLVIAGSGTVEQTLQHQVKQLGMNLVTALGETIPEQSVIFTGYISGAVKKRLIAHSKMLLFATQPDQWQEAFGIVLLEAMAAGKPIVASDIYATRYLQSLGMQATLVQPDGLAEWALQIESLLQNDCKREQMGRINYEHATQFAWETIAKHYQKAYAFCLDK